MFDVIEVKTKFSSGCRSPRRTRASTTHHYGAQTYVTSPRQTSSLRIGQKNEKLGKYWNEIYSQLSENTCTFSPSSLNVLHVAQNVCCQRGQHKIQLWLSFTAKRQHINYTPLWTRDLRD